MLALGVCRRLWRRGTLRSEALARSCCASWNLNRVETLLAERPTSHLISLHGTQELQLFFVSHFLGTMI